MIGRRLGRGALAALLSLIKSTDANAAVARVMPGVIGAPHRPYGPSATTGCPWPGRRAACARRRAGRTRRMR